MHSVIAAILCVLPVIGWAHGQSPGFEVEYTTAPEYTKVYTLTNTYDFPITLRVDVLNKDGSPATDWRVSKDTFKIKPNNIKEVPIQFNTYGQRKLLVCSTLVGVGYDEEKPNVISRVCSRLIINGTSR